MSADTAAASADEPLGATSPSEAGALLRRSARSSGGEHAAAAAAELRPLEREPPATSSEGGWSGVSAAGGGAASALPELPSSAEGFEIESVGSLTTSSLGRWPRRPPGGTSSLPKQTGGAMHACSGGGRASTLAY